MTAPALRLFGASSRARHAAASLTESSPEKLRLARTTGRTVLADYADEPVSIEETDRGTVVLGASHALLLTNDGDVVVKELGEASSRGALPAKVTDSGYGFYGSVQSKLAGAEDVFAQMSEALLAAYPKLTPVQIRDFLDSKHGRHLFDDMTNVAKGKAGEYTVSALVAAVQGTLARAKWVAKELPRYAALPPEESTIRTTDERGNRASFSQHNVDLTEDSDDLLTLHVTFDDLFKSAGMIDGVHWPKLEALVSTAAVVGKARKVMVAAIRKALTTDKTLAPKLRALQSELKFTLKESQDQPMTRLQEEDRAEIVVGDDGLVLLVNGETIAVETCDLQDETDCKRAEAALSAQAVALGYVEIEEGTFDASNERGGRVLNGDEHDNFEDGESYYGRRWRRRTSDASTGHPTMPAVESWNAMTAGAKLDWLAERLDAPRADLLDLIDELDQAAAQGPRAYSAVDEKFVPFKKKGKGKPPPEDEEEPDEDEDEDYEESLVANAVAFLADVVDANTDRATIESVDLRVADGDYESVVDLAESLAIKHGLLQEYKRRMGASLSRFRRSLKTQTSSEKVRNRDRRRQYRSNPTLRRKAARYRVRVKRFMRRESVEEAIEAGTPAAFAAFEDGAFVRWAKSSPFVARLIERSGKDEKARRALFNTYVAEDSLALRDYLKVKGKKTKAESVEGANEPLSVTQLCSEICVEHRGRYQSFAQLKERVAARLEDGVVVSDPTLMQSVSQLVQSGVVQYQAGKGYVVEVLADDAMGQLARAARKAGHRAVVTLAGGQPVFVASMGEANELWRTISPKARGMKTTITDYLKSLGMEEESEAE